MGASNLKLILISSTWEKKKKIFKSWQVCDWLAKWLIVLGFMDLRWPRVYWRSNIGLVTDWYYFVAVLFRKIILVFWPQLSLVANKVISSPLVPHICVSESGQHWFRWWLVAYSGPSHCSNALLLSIVPLETTCSEIWIKIPNFSFKKMHLKMSSVKWWPFFSRGDELTCKNYGMWLLI